MKTIAGHTLEEIKSDLYSGVVSDVLDEMGYRDQATLGDIAPLMEDTVIFGPAFTSIGTQVYSMPESPLTAQCKVVDQLKEGEIYVLVTRGEYTCAVFGEIFGNGVLQRGCSGVLLDGLIRDSKELKEMKFPIFFKGRNPRTSKGRCEINECQIPVDFQGVTINPGDYIYADSDGIIIIPQDIIEEVIEKSYEVVERENVTRSRILKGETMAEVYATGGAV